MAAITSPPKLPPPNTPLVDTKTGQITTPWYQYFLALDDRTRKLVAASNDYETRITALEP